MRAGGTNQTRRTSGTLDGAGGETGRPGSAAPNTEVVTRKRAIGTIGAAPHACATVRSEPGPATTATPSGQQLLHVAARWAVEDAGADVRASAAAGVVAAP
jgi:hypothetical protein